MLFKSKLITNNVDEIRNFARRNNICFQTAKILMQRGIDTDTKLQKFLNPSLDELKDPFLLGGMRECHNRIEEAISKNQSVLIYGDYDVDGISATSILYKFLRDKISTINCFLPSRYEDGYGLTIDSCKKVIDKFHPDLIITVDCGITCTEEVEYLKSQNVDVIITDHHEQAEELPKTIVVDPKIENDGYGFTGLCGAGVALKVVQSFIGKENLTQYLPICAIATVSDIVPLVGENRAIVKLGLSVQEYLPVGVKKLIKNLKIDSINSSAISFKIAPRLNAGGRMGNAYTALDLFISEDENVISSSLKKLLEQNAERQKLSQQIYDDCLAEISKNKLYNNRAIILKSEHWDSGMLGIACARLVDDYFKPVFLFSETDGELKGSVRSISTINIHTLLATCSNSLETYGGHSMAAGVGLKSTNFETFKQEVYNYLSINTKEEDYLPCKTYDIELKPEEITLPFAKELELLEPFGCENSNPQFLVTYNNCSVSKLPNFDSHLNIIVNQTIKFISFNSADFIDDYVFSNEKQSIFELQVNKFNGKEYLKGLIKYTNFFGAKKNIETLFAGRKLKQLYGEKQCTKNINFIKQAEVSKTLNSLLGSLRGTAIIINDFAIYKKYQHALEKYNLEYYVGASHSKLESSCVVFALDNIDGIKNYQNVVFLDGILTKSFVNDFDGTVYVVSGVPVKHEKLNAERSMFGNIFKAIKTVLANGTPYATELELYSQTKKVSPLLSKLSYAQFVFALYSFVEIGVLSLNTQFGFVVSINEGVKSSLENSSFYNKVKFIQKIS
jgi:single-stranded-DNA-specific exonuclease